MLAPDDPLIEEILRLAPSAIGGLLDQDRPRWRELMHQLLGSINRAAGHEERRHLRVAAALDLDVLAPIEVAASPATSTVGAGGISLAVAAPVPTGTLLKLSIKFPQRPMPLSCRAQVVWCQDGHLGAAFIDLFQNDREALEGFVAQRLLASPPA